MEIDSDILWGLFSIDIKVEKGMNEVDIRKEASIKLAERFIQIMEFEKFNIVEQNATFRSYYLDFNRLVRTEDGNFIRFSV